MQLPVSILLDLGRAVAIAAFAPENRVAPLGRSSSAG